MAVGAAATQDPLKPVTHVYSSFPTGHDTSGLLTHATDLHRQMNAQLFWKKSLRFHDAITGSGGDMLNDSTDLIIGLSLIACAGQF